MTNITDIITIHHRDIDEFNYSWVSDTQCILYSNMLLGIKKFLHITVSEHVTMNKFVMNMLHDVI